MDLDLSLEVENLPCGATRAKGFHVRPLLDFIWVADFGQPAQSRGGIIVADSESQHWRYRHEEWRFGHVLAVGPGRWREGTRERMPMPDIAVGDTVMFLRRVGTRFSHIRFHHPLFPNLPRGLYVRVLDPDKAAIKVIEWEPWWNLEDGILDPDSEMSG